MGDISHERFLLFRSVSFSAFIEKCQDCTQISYIDHAWCDHTDEVQQRSKMHYLVIAHCTFHLLLSLFFRQQIEAVFDDVKVVDVLDSRDQTHLALMSRPELGVTFTKLHCWTLTNYEKCVFLDADTLVRDKLFK